MSKGKFTKGAGKEASILAALAEIAHLCSGGEPTDRNCRAILLALRGLVQFDAATLYLAGRPDGLLQETASIGKTVKVLDFLKMEQGDGLTGWAADVKKPVLLSDRSGHRDFDPACDYASFLSIPLMEGEQTLGVLNFGSRTPGTYTADEVQVMSLITGQLAVLIGRLRLDRLYAEAQAQLAQLRQELEDARDADVPVAKPEEVEEIAAQINHDINNSLAILIGNVQCILMDNTVTDQKTLSRLRRMERALMKINDANHRILELVKIVQHRRRQHGHDLLDEKEPTRSV